MKKFKLSSVFIVLLLSAAVFIVSCDIDNDIDPESRVIKGFNLENYPRVDGSTSTDPLNVLTACKLIGIKYQWVKSGNCN